MRLTVLGNNGPYPAPGGACSGYLLESDSGETKILLDCGTGVLSRLTDRISLDELERGGAQPSALRPHVRHAAHALCSAI